MPLKVCVSVPRINISLARVYPRVYLTVRTSIRTNVSSSLLVGCTAALYVVAVQCVLPPPILTPPQLSVAAKLHVRSRHVLDVADGMLGGVFRGNLLPYVLLHTADFCSLILGIAVALQDQPPSFRFAFALLSPWSGFATFFALLFVYALPVCWFARPAQSSTCSLIPRRPHQGDALPTLTYLSDRPFASFIGARLACTLDNSMRSHRYIEAPLPSNRLIDRLKGFSSM